MNEHRRAMRMAAAVLLISGVLATESCLFDAGLPLCPQGRQCAPPARVPPAHVVDGGDHAAQAHAGATQPGPERMTASSPVSRGARPRLDQAAAGHEASHGAGHEAQVIKRGCGNGVTEPARGEQCDPGDADGNGAPDSTAACDADCTIPVCGDGVVNARAGEQCDPGDGGTGVAVDTATCDADCTIPVCGDGHPNPAFVNPATGRAEDCDEGKSTFSCDGDCSYPHCGDGFLNLAMGEDCDDGNEDQDDACPSGPFGNCRFATCGDGFLHAGREGCDVYHEDRCDPDGLCRLADCTCQPR